MQDNNFSTIMTHPLPSSTKEPSFTSSTALSFAYIGYLYGVIIIILLLLIWWLAMYPCTTNKEDTYFQNKEAIELMNIDPFDPEDV